jgi:hypothetical protein
MLLQIVECVKARQLHIYSTRFLHCKTSECTVDYTKIKPSKITGRSQAKNRKSYRAIDGVWKGRGDILVSHANLTSKSIQYENHTLYDLPIRHLLGQAVQFCWGRNSWADLRERLQPSRLYVTVSPDAPPAHRLRRIVQFPYTIYTYTLTPKPNSAYYIGEISNGISLRNRQLGL